MIEIDPFFILEEEEYENEDLIFREGSPTDWVYFILEGDVKIQKNTSKGPLTITTLTEGNFLGEMAFFEKENVQRSASAIAVGRVKLGVLDRDRLAREYNSLSPTFRKVISTLVQRLRHVTAQVTKFASVK